jgi:hypothetical protein
MNAKHEICRWPQQFFAVWGDYFVGSMLTCGKRRMAHEQNPLNLPVMQQIISSVKGPYFE